MPNNYNPSVTRDWSRVQNKCTFLNPDDVYNPVFVPFSGQTMTLAQANLEKQLYYKGNILQYKKNAYTLTKTQRYSKLAQGFGPNRTKGLGTQTETYTNPNTNNFLRVNYTTVSFPNEIIGEPNNISGPFQYNVRSPFGCSDNSVQVGGSLVAGSFSDQCTGVIRLVKPTSNIICNPAYSSNVPGNAILCWNTKLPTVFPRPRYSMNNSANKWPQGAKELDSAIKPPPPVLTLDSYLGTTAVISWTIVPNDCLPISSYNIYKNGELLTTVRYTTTSITINNVVSTDKFYVTSLSDTIESLPSNTISLS